MLSGTVRPRLPADARKVCLTKETGHDEREGARNE